MAAARPVSTGTPSGRPPQLAEVRRLALLIAHQDWGGQEPRQLAQQATQAYRSTFGAAGHPPHLHSWLRMTLRRLAEATIRGDLPERWSERRSGEPDEVEWLVGLVLRQLSTPSVHVLGQELLERALAQVRRPDRRVLQMRLVGLTTEDVAQRVGATATDVTQAYRRARQQLRETIERDPALAEDLRRYAR